MLDTIRIRTHDEQTAVTLANDALARFRPTLSHDDDEWELVVEGETEDDVPDLVSILRQRLADPDSSVSLLVNGEPRPVAPRPGI
jgi:hypothetical protein